jgi:integrase
MSIEKHKRKKGVVYRVKIHRNGVAISKNFDRIYDAQQFEREIRMSGDRVNVRYTFSQAADEWLVNHAEVRKAPRSVYTDKQMLRDNLLPHFGSMPLRDIAPELLDHFIGRLRKDVKSPSTINRNLELFRTIFNYAIKRRRALYNPIKAVGLMRIQEPPFDYWETHEADQFLRYTEQKHQRTRGDLAFLYKFAINTGCRLGEILGLGWSDVNLGNRLIAIRRSYDSYQRKIKDMTKGRKIRHVPINSAIYDDLVRMKAERKGDLVFATISGNPKDRSNVTHYFQRDTLEAGVRKIRFHDLRHTYASHFMMNGGDIYHLKEILGHSDIKTTQRYAHLSKSFLVDKADTVCFSTGEKVIRVNFNKDAANA